MNKKNYDDLKELYLNVNSQFRRYIGHVSTNVGGVFEDLKSNEEKGSVYVHVPKAQQKAAIIFLNSYVFGSLDWLIKVFSCLNFSNFPLEIFSIILSPLPEFFSSSIIISFSFSNVFLSS